MTDKSVLHKNIIICMSLQICIDDINDWAKIGKKKFNMH